MLLVSTPLAAAAVQYTDSYSALQHPNEHIDGFSLHAVHLAKHDGDGRPVGLHRRRLRFDDHPPRRRLLYAPFSATENSRDRVITLMKLNVAAYPGYLDTMVDRTWSQEMMDGILSENRQIYQAGTNVTKAQDDAANDAVNAAAKTDMNVTDEFKNTDWFERFSPDATAKYTTGVAAIEWVREDVTVLVFRGSSSEGDIGNVVNWFYDYAIERSTTRMREAWTEDANLAWTSEMQARHNKGDLFARTALRTAGFLESATMYDGTPSSGGFVDGIVAAVANDSSLSSSITFDSTIARATGYWTLTKRMVNEVVDALPSGQALLLTGHSQGATRAQLASMYLTKSRGASYTTQTYAATRDGRRVRGATHVQLRRRHPRRRRSNSGAREHRRLHSPARPVWQHDARRRQRRQRVLLGQRRPAGGRQRARVLLPRLRLHGADAPRRAGRRLPAWRRRLGRRSRL